MDMCDYATRDVTLAAEKGWKKFRITDQVVERYTRTFYVYAANEKDADDFYSNLIDTPDEEMMYDRDFDWSDIEEVKE